MNDRRNLRRWTLATLPGMHPERDRLADLARQLDDEHGGDARQELFRAMQRQQHFDQEPADDRLREILHAVRRALAEGVRR